MQILWNAKDFPGGGEVLGEFHIEVRGLCFMLPNDNVLTRRFR